MDDVYKYKQCTIDRIQRELREITSDPVEMCTASPVDEANITYWQATIEGPPDSPYDGGLFHLDIVFPCEYPFKPPMIYFTTKIYHPNISRKGAICLDILKQNWVPGWTISKVLLAISSLLTDPNPNDPLEIDIANLYINDRDTYNRTVHDWVITYAMPNNIPNLRFEEDDETF